MFKNWILPALLLALLVSLTNCGTRKKMVYFQGESLDSLSTSNQYTPTFKPDDLLLITVMGNDPETIAPFNFPNGSTPSNFGYSTGNPALQGYLIGQDGNINFPVIGLVNIGGLSREKAINLLQDKLKAYISNPIVNIQIQNFKITVLGEVRNPGTFKIPNERITILEAIALAGDLKATGIRKVKVIREENGSKREYLLDLASQDIFSSPCYYLQQNDVVYVEPNQAARYESTLVKLVAPIIISITSLAISTIIIITR